MTSLENLEKIHRDENMEWWRPSKEDNYNLEKKLFRTGCRPIQRKYLECTRKEGSNLKKCSDLEVELNKCIALLQFLYQTKPEMMD